MKKCFKCKIIKDISEFYKHSQMADGHLNKCKECTKKDTRNNYRNNFEYYKEYDRGRAKLPHRKQRAAQYQREHPEQKKQSIIKYRKLNPEKYKAHNIVNYALRKGEIFKSFCFCGSSKVHAHHEDYSKPLDVKWICPKHHAELHKNYMDNK